MSLSKHNTAVLLSAGFVLVLLLTGFHHSRKPLPKGLDYRGRAHPAGKIKFLGDFTARRLDNGQPVVRQEIFEQALQMIEQARDFIVADFFLVNEFAGESAEKDGTPLSQRFVEALIAARERNPDLQAIFITDPFNTLYGAVGNPGFDRLEAAGIELVITDLHRLRDSNLLFSPFWRLLPRRWRQPAGPGVPNPVGDGKISLTSLLEMLNFKANHRKVLATDGPDGRPRGLVTSANPHSASARHGNVGIYLTGRAVLDLLRSEEAVYKFSTGRTFPPPISCLLQREDFPPDDENGPLARVVTEKAIKRKLLQWIGDCGPEDEVAVAMFYFSDTSLRRALAAAARRGARVRVLLDPNRDAFGRSKNGIPNRQVGAFLHNRGAEVRWYHTQGEQFHSKMALFSWAGEEAGLLLGSANWTRRNLDNLNLETNLAITGQAEHDVFRQAGEYFALVWDGRRQGYLTGLDFEAFSDRSWSRRLLYRIMEHSGASSF